MTELDEVRRLAAGADQEASQATQLLRAQTSLMQALRETQNDMNDRLGSISRTIGHQGEALGTLLLEISKIQTRLRGIEDQMHQQGNQLTQIERDHGQRLDQIDNRLTGVDGKLDEILRRLET